MISVDSRAEVIPSMQHDQFDDDPMARLAAHAEEQLLKAGLTGATNGDVNPAMLHLATSAWIVRRFESTLRDHREALVQELRDVPDEPTGKFEAVKRQGPAAGVGAGIVAVIAWVRDFIMSGS